MPLIFYTNPSSPPSPIYKTIITQKIHCFENHTHRKKSKLMFNPWGFPNKLNWNNPYLHFLSLFFCILQSLLNFEYVMLFIFSSHFLQFSEISHYHCVIHHVLSDTSCIHRILEKNFCIRWKRLQKLRFLLRDAQFMVLFTFSIIMS